MNADALCVTRVLESDDGERSGISVLDDLLPRRRLRVWGGHQTGHEGFDGERGQCLCQLRGKRGQVCFRQGGQSSLELLGGCTQGFQPCLGCLWLFFRSVLHLLLCRPGPGSGPGLGPGGPGFWLGVWLGLAACCALSAAELFEAFEFCLLASLFSLGSFCGATFGCGTLGFLAAHVRSAFSQALFVFL